jgi:hypothetical protein
MYFFMSPTDKAFMSWSWYLVDFPQFEESFVYDDWWGMKCREFKPFLAPLVMPRQNASPPLLYELCNALFRCHGGNLIMFLISH